MVQKSIGLTINKANEILKRISDIIQICEKTRSEIEGMGRYTVYEIVMRGHELDDDKGDKGRLLVSYFNAENQPIDRRIWFKNSGTHAGISVDRMNHYVCDDPSDLESRISRATGKPPILDFEVNERDKRKIILESVDDTAIEIYFRLCTYTLAEAHARINNQNNYTSYHDAQDIEIWFNPYNNTSGFTLGMYEYKFICLDYGNLEEICNQTSTGTAEQPKRHVQFANKISDNGNIVTFTVEHKGQTKEYVYTKGETWPDPLTQI